MSQSIRVLYKTRSLSIKMLMICMLLARLLTEGGIHYQHGTILRLLIQTQIESLHVSGNFLLKHKLFTSYDTFYLKAQNPFLWEEIFRSTITYVHEDNCKAVDVSLSSPALCLQQVNLIFSLNQKWATSNIRWDPIEQVGANICRKYLQ